MTTEKDLFEHGTEADRLYGAEYRQGVGNCNPTNPENRFDEAKPSVESSTLASSNQNVEAKQLAAQLVQKDDKPVMAFEHPVVDYINQLLPNGAPEGSRHKFALKIASDIIILCDGDLDRARRVLLSLQWVQDVIKERGQDEIERILQTAQKRMQKKEAENYGEPLPSKEMRDAIKLVTGCSYKQLCREAHLTAEGRELAAAEYDIMRMLENIGSDVEKLFPHFEVHDYCAIG